MTRYAVCFTVRDTSGEVHTRFDTVAVQPGYNTVADIPRELAIRHALGGLAKHVALISALELDEES